jgi:hypothetical protein
MNNIEKDEERVTQHYIKMFIDNVRGNLFYYICTYSSYLMRIPDLSEEFHRKYAPYYDGTHWYTISNHQTNFPEDLYDLALDNTNRPLFIGVNHFIKHLISNNKVSEKWIKRNFHRIPPEMWQKVYE